MFIFGARLVFSTLHLLIRLRAARGYVGFFGQICESLSENARRLAKITSGGLHLFSEGAIGGRGTIGS
jgi:hypothetical protein